MHNDGLPAINTRLSYSGHIGTVRYAGKVDNTTGLWLGIEWDDPTRGKHNGSKDGKQYFHCRTPNSGSFIRPNPQNIQYGITFLEALQSKYVESLHGTGSLEKVILGSSRGVIEVEAVNLDKIRSKFANLGRLKWISLDNELVARGNDPGAIQATCPNVIGVNLSSSLLSSWQDVALITKELPLLHRLILNKNRFTPPPREPLIDAFSGITELQISETMMTWDEMQTITASMPQILAVEFGYNSLTKLVSSFQADLSQSKVQSINLDSNMLGDWIHICTSIRPYPVLERLVLTSNRIECIPPRTPDVDPLLSLKHLSLPFNKLGLWSDIDSLHTWFPALESLALTGNPLAEDQKHSRPFSIARLPTLQTIDGTKISTKERTDCELFYLSYIAQNEDGNDQQQRRVRHPQWDALCLKHGSPEDGGRLKRQNANSDKLGARLIELKLFQQVDNTTPTSPIQDKEPTISMQALPSMTLRVFRMKLCKAMKCIPAKTNMRLWLVMGNGSLEELGDDWDKRDLDWIGIENHSQLFFHILPL